MSREVCMGVWKWVNSVEGCESHHLPSASKMDRSEPRVAVGSTRGGAQRQKRVRLSFTYLVVERGC